MSKKIVVIGSTNTDMVVRTRKLPAPGETILGGEFFTNAGGKGANQAVAAARLGGDVVFIAKTGNDVFGAQSRALFAKENIDCQYVFVDTNTPSGVALITIDERGENCIVVASGANNLLTTEDVMLAKQQLEQAEIVLMQLETPLDTVTQVAQAVNALNKKIILNPAPACPLPEDLLRCLYLITPNETEAELLTGIKVVDEASAHQAAQALHRQGVQNVIVTMGSQGAYLYSEGQGELIATVKVQAVDTTAAGDTFNGAIAAALADGKSLRQAVAFGNKAAAISVTRPGAQSSVPYLHELLT